MIGFEPTDEQALIVDTVRQFAEQEIRPAARSSDEAGALPEPVLAQAHELGLVSNAIPEAQGGGGERNAVTGVLIAEELAWGDLSIALGILSPSLLAMPVAEFGTEAQQKEVLPGLCTDRFVPGALALLEPRLGQDPFRPAASAKPDGANLRIDGTKCRVPWQEGGPTVLVLARDPDGSTQAYLVPRDAAGLRATPERNMGLQALPLAELTLDGVIVPSEARLGGTAGIDLPRVLAQGRTALAALGVGVARAAYEIARDYAKEREAFGVKIAQKQAIAFKLADMAIEIDGARLLTWEAAFRLDQGDDALRESTLALDQVRRIALDVCDGAVQVFGGHGYTREYLPEMHLRNIRGFSHFEALALV